MPALRISPCRHILSFFVTGLALWFICAASAEEVPSPSYTDLERRVRELEHIVRQLQAERQPAGAVPGPVLPAAVGPVADEQQPDGDVLEQGGAGGQDAAATGKAAATGRPAVAGWDKGFFLRSVDKKYNLRITGQIQSDGRAFLDGTDTTDIDTFLVRRARLGIEATVFDYYEFRLLPDFGQGQARIQDSYLNVHYWDSYQVQAGKFKEPFSFEQLIPDRYVPTMERSLIDQMTPARDVGLMFHGQKLVDDRLDYGVGIFNGEINGDIDTNDRKDIAARIAVRPFNGPRFPCWLQRLQVGCSATTGIEQEPISPAILRTPATVPWFAFNAGVLANGLRNRWSPELSYFYGPVGFATQYLRVEQDIQRAATFTPVRVPFDGWYVLATLLLTGEERTSYSQQITPLRPFDPRCRGCIGAWELVTRVSRLELGDVVFAPGPAQLANPTLFSRGATEMTLGFNWYLNAWVRVQFNWERAWFDDPVRLGSGPAGLFSHQDTLLGRFQVIF